MRHHATLRIALTGTIASVLFIVSGCGSGGLDYPATRRVDHTDVYHGVTVADPYRWLENDVREDTAVAAWIAAQNEVTFRYLESIPDRAAIARRLTQLWDYERYGTPAKEAGVYYYSKNDGLQSQSVLYAVDSLNGTPRIVLDPNTWSEDGTVSLGGKSFSEDGRYLAYAKAESGSDWRTWYVRDLRTGEDLPDTLTWVKWTSLAWSGDAEGFFYARYPVPETEAAFQQTNLNQKVYFHRRGTHQSEDEMIYERPDQPEWSFSPKVTEDGRYLILSVWEATDENLVYYRDLTRRDAPMQELIGQWNANYHFLGNDGRVFYFQTELDAPKGRVVAINTRNPDPSRWRTILPENEDALRSTRITGDLLFASYLEDASTQVRVFTLEGEHVRDVELPGLGSAWGFGGRRSDSETFYSFSSYATPPSIYHYDLLTGQSTLWRRAQIAIDTDAYTVEQVFFTSKDGTRVPMFITHKKGFQRDGSQPTLLYGYGGFNASLTPYFSITTLAWLEMGGVYAVANTRGGGEYGEEWHEAGTKLNRQNVFDDFIAAAEYLIAEGYTRPERLAVQGTSNGGLLVGAVMTQRPDLFGVCLPGVGVMDMLRFHKFTAGRFWTYDYGSSDNEEEFKAQYAYSPYHNLTPGTTYPATLVTTADTDDRVIPAHSFKFAAALQYAHTGDAPVLIRIETRAGHGGGTPTGKLIKQNADRFAFLVTNLRMTLPEGYAAP